ncbi:uncharacterized protein PV07_01186 [Cladophialophora immunda]|uniref:Uncharacterized protein n=1 Tax=Cladophialophora immunda TaxID=569365 RepID=A0A0D2CTC6_9EURO|nr:uncharacterized protein PV07_01186 [Cladophialophora immunda]KIW34408.1 hypothetical protein PV07_01186 [Cladophialophora immunda]
MSIFSRVRGRLSEAEDQAPVDPHEWRLPSVYSISKPGSRDTVIPNPRIFRNAFVPRGATDGRAGTSLVYPDISHAAVHLALLESFRGLRLTAGRLDVDVEKPAVSSEKAEPAEHPARTRLPASERWDLLIRLAVTRFTAWWTNIDRILYHATAFTHHAGGNSVVQLTKDYLPPLDVLLVWYAFMLDEDTYTAACHGRGTPRLGELCFPWPAIRDVLDLDAMTYKLPPPAANLFSTLTSQSADILTYLEGPPAYSESPELPLEIDLFAEVKRCERFIEDAHRLLWIRSPALKGSLERSSIQYLEFRLSTGPADLPPYDIPFGVELIWKTHKLYPSLYRLFRQEITPTFPDSKSPNPPPQTAVDPLARAGHPSPSECCCCWTCERIRDDLPSFRYDRSASALSLPVSPAQLRSIQDDLGFYRAVEKARGSRLPLPTRPPTAAEKTAEALEAQKQAAAGWLPGLNEYMVTLPNGERKIKRARAKHARAIYGMMV